MEKFRLWSNRYLRKYNLEDTQILLFGLFGFIIFYIVMDYTGHVIH